MNKIPDVPIGSTTPRLRAVQSNITTNATIECADGLVDDPIGYIASTSTSNSINNNNNNQRRGVGLEMAKRTEAEPLLDENSGGNGAGIHSYRDLNEVDREMLIADKPVSIRTHSSGNVYLLNFLAFLFVFVNMTLNLTVLSIIHERVPMNEPHLPDIAFDILPDHRQFLDVTEYFIVFQMTSIFILLFFHRHRILDISRISPTVKKANDIMAIVSSGTNRNDTNQHNLCDHCTWTLFYRRHNSLFRYYPYLLDLSCHVRLELNFSIQHRRHEKSWNDPPMFSIDQLNNASSTVPLSKRYRYPQQQVQNQQMNYGQQQQAGGYGFPGQQPQQSNPSFQPNSTQQPFNSGTYNNPYPMDPQNLQQQQQHQYSQQYPMSQPVQQQPMAYQPQSNSAYPQPNQFMGQTNMTYPSSQSYGQTMPQVQPSMMMPQHQQQQQPQQQAYSNPQARY
ncbi:hypothetical protein RDWZM_004362 [Blomia tropicalis]|uniref:Uncharacterized protein n=1 Tax=Blomia tropicalis TaxID=40697 RepID=A0A9Q0MHI3_BLOTA|nr:hypothetical protein RDWZM_004362 [Blomia tropicalis]